MSRAWTFADAGRDGAKSHAWRNRGIHGWVEMGDTCAVDAAEREKILSRYQNHSRRFETDAARRAAGRTGSVIRSSPATDEIEQPTAREIEVLQLVAEGLLNREIGTRLFLSEETVKSHIRHLLAKLHARSRADAVAVGFRRSLIV